MLITCTYGKFLSRAVLLTALSALTACGFIGEKGTNQSGSNVYHEAIELPRTEVPNEYDSYTVVDLYPIPPLSEAADETLIDEDNLPLPTPMTNDAEGLVQLQLFNQDYWILVKETPSEVWAKLKQFTQLFDLKFIAENPASGFIVATDNNYSYHFRVEQGLQRKSAEISLRVLGLSELNITTFPVKSDAREKEIATLEMLTNFLTGHEAQTAYSYAALGISTQRRITVKGDPGSGIKYLIIREQADRTKASLKQALIGASFKVIDFDAESITAEYMPQLPEEYQPSFLLRLFGVGAKEFDDNIEFAGRTYRFLLVKGRDQQILRIAKTDILNDEEVEEGEATKKRELNTILMIIKRSLY